MVLEFPIRFGYIPYPLWRRRYPIGIKQVLYALYPTLYPVRYDRHPPTSSTEIASFLRRYQLIPTVTAVDVETAVPPILPRCDDPYPEHPSSPIRLIAQWERLEAVLMSWCLFYPRLWLLHADMVRAIAPVAQVHVIVPNEWWARAVWLYLTQHGYIGDHRHQVKFILIPTDDVWIRDYGPMLGYNRTGQRGGVKGTYDHLPDYPQERDNAMPFAWSKYTQTPLYDMNLSIEGGNLLTDGKGTLFTTSKTLSANRQFATYADLEAYLHRLLDFDKLIVTPRMRIERTGHIDLLMKLLDEKTVMLATPSSKWDTARLDEVRHIFRTTTNAQGDPYHIIELPTPPLYFNWLVYPIRRSYTNSLTVNGRILVPIYRSKTDDIAIHRYETYAKRYEIIPIDCSVGINGGGAIHCMTREVPITQL